MDEGRREQAAQQSEPVQRSGGVRVDSTSASSVRVSWEVCGGGPQAQHAGQAGDASQAGGAVAQVGVSHSSQVVEMLDAYFSGQWPRRRPRADTCSKQSSEVKDTGMAGATQIRTPDKVRQLQRTLYRKAKAEPQYRFWSLYGELCRLDVLATALEAQIRNNGRAGVDGESLAAIKASPELYGLYGLPLRANWQAVR